MHTNDATRAHAEAMPATTPIQSLFREWEVKNRHASKGGFTSDEIAALCDELDADADRFLGQDSTCPLDWVAKILAASDNLTISVRDEWVDSIREEGIAFVQGAPEAGPIFDPSKLNMEGLFDLHDALKTIFEVFTALICQPRFVSDGNVFSPAGEMLEKLRNSVAGLLEAIDNEASGRPVKAPNDAAQKFFFLANRMVDGLTDPAYAMEELTKSVASLGEVRS
ncbi:hypothetical protein [Mesorhizobium sp. KR1-2]|uniref:hypothetical protein n=1 Tax=Mesorhizobium sp. KR1-2 TaxID=3156609 RepID=UPI0032B5790D